MGPVRQNPIQRTVSLFICVCIALCTFVAHNIAQNRPDSFPPYPPDNHHISDDVYLREGGYSGIHPSFMIPLYRFVNHWILISPVTSIISATSPDMHGASCFFIFFSAAIILGIIIQSAGPFFTLEQTAWSHIFYSFIKFSIYFFYASFIPFSFTTNLPVASFRQLESVTSAFPL